MNAMLLGYIRSGSVWTVFAPTPAWLFVLLLASIILIAMTCGVALGIWIERRREARASGVA